MLTSQTIGAAAIAGERASWRPSAGTLNGRVGNRAVAATVAPLDRVATAVDGAESSHGADSRMWRPDPSGPQGPMQVTEAAATDVGGGNRFDVTQNRAIGRAYLSQLFGRYRNWPDAIAAYNWGIGNMDVWVKAGRPADKLLAGVTAYLRRVLHESGLCNGAEAAQKRQSDEAALPAAASTSGSDPLVSSACSPAEFPGRVTGIATGSTGFSRRLDRALQLALQRAVQGP
jgi:hypothetical protein